MAIRRVLAIKETSSQNVRLFKVPELRLDAEDYTEMIDWKTTERFVPPLLKDVDKEDLKKCIEMQNIPNLNFLNLPCHNQGVERMVKLVTEASGKVAGQTSRDGMIRSKIKSRDMIPKYNSKKDFK